MTPNTIKSLYLIINNATRYIEEGNGNKYLPLVLTDEGKDILKKYEQTWRKIKGLIRLTNSNSDDYDEEYIKIKLNSDVDLP